MESLVGFDSGMSLSFLHKRVGAGLSGFLTGGIGGGIAGFFEGGGGTVMAGPDRCGIPAFTPGESPAISEARFRCANPVPGQDPGNIIVNPPFIGGPGVGVSLVPTQPMVPSAQAGEGVAVIGAFGVAAMTPFIVGAIMDHHGVLQPVRRCLAGAVLGRDNLCYPSNMKGLQRKWPRHKCSSPLDKKLKALKAAGSAVTSLKGSLKGTGFKISKT